MKKKKQSKSTKELALVQSVGQWVEQSTREQKRRTAAAEELQPCPPLRYHSHSPCTSFPHPLPAISHGLVFISETLKLMANREHFVTYINTPGNFYEYWRQIITGKHWHSCLSKWINAQGRKIWSQDMLHSIKYNFPPLIFEAGHFKPWENMNNIMMTFESIFFLW